MKRSIIAICCFGAGVCTGGCRHPTDEVFRTTFAEKQHAFADVAADIDASGIAGYITPSQQTAILSRLHSPLLHENFTLARREDGSVLFGYSAYGLSIGGSRKGIARVPANSVRFYTVLNTNSAWPSGDGDFLKPLEGDWYIYEINN
jgi:hypothetical protein